MGRGRGGGLLRCIGAQEGRRQSGLPQAGCAWAAVHCRAVFMASASFVFQWRAMFSSSGSSGLGADMSAWMLQGCKGGRAVVGNRSATLRCSRQRGACPWPLPAASTSTTKQRSLLRSLWDSGPPGAAPGLPARGAEAAQMSPPPPAPPEQHGADLQRGAPLVLQDIQADAAQLVHVGVVDFGQEAHLGGVGVGVGGRRAWQAGQHKGAGRGGPSRGGATFCEAPCDCESLRQRRWRRKKLHHARACHLSTGYCCPARPPPWVQPWDSLQAGKAQA